MLRYFPLVMLITTVTAADEDRCVSLGGYVNFVTIGVWDESYGFVMALVVFLATLKFINMLKFNRRMGMLTCLYLAERVTAHLCECIYSPG